MDIIYILIFILFIAIILAVILAVITYSHSTYPKIKVIGTSSKKKSYLLCRKPLQGIETLYALFLKRNYTSDSLDNVFEHHHFFLIDDILDLHKPLNNIGNIDSFDNILNDLPLKMAICKSCEENNFHNFGFFDNTEIKCNGSISEYTECHMFQFDEHIMKEAIKMMRRNYIEYNLYFGNQYNCQTFSTHMINAYKIVEENMGPMSANTLSEHNSSVINKVKHNLLTLFGIQTKKEDTKFSYKWGENPYYIKKES